MAIIGSDTRTNIWIEKDPDVFASLFINRLQNYNVVGDNGYGLHRWYVSLGYAHLYGMDVEGAGANAAIVSRQGEQGTEAGIRSAKAASRLDKAFNITVSQELVWRAVATNTDQTADAKAVTADDALEYYWFNKDVAHIAKSACHDALAYGESAVHVFWDETLGDDAAIDPDTNRPIKTGDIDYRKVNTWNIARDPHAKSFVTSNWVAIRDYRNKFDLAAQASNPKIAEAALNAGGRISTVYWDWAPNKNVNFDSDLVPVWYVYHKRTPSVPEGLQAILLENGVAMSVKPLDQAYWKQLPLIRIAMGEREGTPWPFTKYFLTLGSSQARDNLNGALLTNATAVAGVNIWADPSFQAVQLGGGPKLFPRQPNDQKPEVLQFQVPDQEQFNLIHSLDNDIDSIWGLDAVTSGKESGVNMSGEALVALASNSVQNNAQAQATWGRFAEQLGMMTLSTIEFKFTVPKKIVLAGSFNKDLVRVAELTPQVVQGVEQVQVRLQSAIAKTPEDRLKFAQNLLQTKPDWFPTPEMLQTVADTGRLDSLTQIATRQQNLISQENEKLSQGQAVTALASDDHKAHIREHFTVTASLDARGNQAVIQAAEAHINDHVMILTKMDPYLRMIMGQPQPPPAPPAGPPPAPPISDSTKLGMTKMAVDHGWAPTPQAAQQVFDSGSMAPQPPQGPPGSPQPAPAAPPGLGPTPAMPPPAAPQGPVAPPTGSGPGPNLPKNPFTGERQGPASGSLPPTLPLK